MATRPHEQLVLRWGVKHSFVDYVTDLDDGLVETSGLVEDDDARNGFAFLATSPAGATDLGAVVELGGEVRLAFSGRVRFRGHRGILDVVIADPTLDLGPSAGALSVGDAGNPQLRTTIATFDEWGPSAGGTGDLTWAARAPRLTFDGTYVFGGTYLAGTQLDELTIARTTFAPS